MNNDAIVAVYVVTDEAKLAFVGTLWTSDDEMKAGLSAGCEQQVRTPVVCWLVCASAPFLGARNAIWRACRRGCANQPTQLPS